MVLSVKNLDFDYGTNKIIENISFHVEPGDFISILGVNGSGKSTLIKCLNKILKCDEGVVFIENQDINNLKNNDIAKIIGYVPQNLEKGFLTVFDTVLLGRKPYIEWNVSEDDIELTWNIIKSLNLEDLALRYVNELSGGELQKVIIARALVQEPKILLLDEPTSGLDLKNQFEVMKFIKKISKEHAIASIIVMHDLNLAIRYCDKFIMLKKGGLIISGDMCDLSANHIKQIYGVDVYIKKFEGIPFILPIF